ncbi:olfactory receptor 52A1-like [Poecilia formosa]|uniref:olfactory receptor 52A1-like n=1 Tax=Poecilia formosa TaxID=48698 RepID=UPI0007BA7054|nr:PREDICTED: olfactory receptor 52A1-like [Poecilia formosa]
MSSSSAPGTNFTVTEGNLTGPGVNLGMLSLTAVICNLVVILLGIITCSINTLMIHIFNKHQIFRFNPRYILFIHLVLNKTLQLILSISLYLFANSYFTIYVSLCMFILLPAILTTRNTPVNLACMAAECYISVCIPLRHGNICTVKKTYIAIGIMWVISLLTILPDIFILFITEELHFLKTRVFCDRDRVFRSSVSKNKRDASHIFFLVVVCLILFYTYFRVLFVAKAANSDAKKARNTILLHGFQMLMCMTLYMQTLLKQLLIYLFPGQRIPIQHTIFILIQIIPRCLSPVVYGIRDKTFRMGTTTPFCQSRGTAPDVHGILQSLINQHNPTTFRALRNSGRIPSTPGALPQRSSLSTLVTSSPEIGEPNFNGRYVGGIEDVFKVFCPPAHNVQRHGQQHTIPTNSVRAVMLPFPEMLDDGPKSP